METADQCSVVLECAQCGFGVPHVYERGPHIRADCAQCGRYLKFVPRSEEWLALLKA